MLTLPPKEFWLRQTDTLLPQAPVPLVPSKLALPSTVVVLISTASAPSVERLPLITGTLEPMGRVVKSDPLPTETLPSITTAPTSLQVPPGGTVRLPVISVNAIIPVHVVLLVAAEAACADHDAMSSAPHTPSPATTRVRRRPL